MGRYWTDLSELSIAILKTQNEGIFFEELRPIHSTDAQESVESKPRRTIAVPVFQHPIKTLLVFFFFWIFL